ncbi:hypothetical protein FSARC_3442 [Fusarium sarcochroum]|uniref:Uncharacterized protein n=1 Tax=Fusarium sarcochroum TaxID=1208366 RepID=A0A8H4XBV1_9HYPO|nr:hypothetical protein FSARC_3442 [Fusarium sarcochroum]
MSSDNCIKYIVSTDGEGSIVRSSLSASTKPVASHERVQFSISPEDFDQKFYPQLHHELKKLAERLPGINTFYVSTEVLKDGTDAVAIAARSHLQKTDECSGAPFRFGSTSQEKEDVVIHCVLCGMKTHTMGTCLDIDEGEMMWCPFCNTIEHQADECDKFTAMSLTQKVHFLVHERVNMPPVASETPWWDYLLTWLNDDSSKGEKLPPGFPWTKEFTMKVAARERGRYIKKVQVEFDKGRDHSCLPVDEETRSIEDVQRKYWMPARVREMQAAMDVDN